ncbi:uncharacterized protein BXZ73DRAFT_100036 [Epithele typhae]|uniref:uncharacterized protein n=1 Tax=Epithele typhae TaxID=378194 RepID=UPI002007533F|nr:uncharacterized protein BXZ73DRAFT_100036 [Epithele typhae]KAH9937822.1 hypothetical protein BXZ73DRAFT_100036 [Epithele typhae]
MRTAFTSDIVNWHKVVVDLLEKRSLNRLGRDPSAMIYIAGWAFTYATSQKLEAHRLVRRLYDEPENLLHHLRRFFWSSVLGISHGIEVDDDPVDYLKMVAEAMEIWSMAFG